MKSQKIIYTNDPETRRLAELPVFYQPSSRLIKEGVGDLSTVDLLATVLDCRYSLPLAEELLAKFGSLAGVARAGIDELTAFKEIDRKTAVLLKACIELGLRYVIEEVDSKGSVSMPLDAAAILIPRLAHLQQEELHVILLDTRNFIIDEICIYKGTVNECSVRIAEILRPAIVSGAVGIVIGHNHPSGDPAPSDIDIAVTQQIKDACLIMDIELLDHIIIGKGGRYTSIKETGYGFD